MGSEDRPRALLRYMLDTAILSVSPDHVVPPHLPRPPPGRTVVFGAGNAAAAMARPVEASWPAQTASSSGQASDRAAIRESRFPAARSERVARHLRVQIHGHGTGAWTNV
ncbi:DUF4147 domain-containing protein [Burkholderia cenocepacia]|nr:DUF4147 domain-containing protein [Burkholderia cenocepacia]RQU56994.1 DUF4147 domain-containing protein [Burkholderia cenocepacia]